MKTTAISLPALCQLPLIEASRSTIEIDASKLEWRPTGFLFRILAKVWEAIISRVPVGYEDGTGFHHGVAAVLPPVVRASRLRNRRAGKTCFQARWKTMRVLNLDSGGRLVLQWDSSSLPPCQLSPGSFLTRSRPRHLAAKVHKEHRGGARLPPSRFPDPQPA